MTYKCLICEGEMNYFGDGIFECDCGFQIIVPHTENLYEQVLYAFLYKWKQRAELLEFAVTDWINEHMDDSTLEKTLREDYYSIKVLRKIPTKNDLQTQRKA